MNDVAVTIETNRGPIELTLFASKTPVTVANFLNLIERGFYDGVKFHRVIDNFMVQTGDPQGNGTGGPGYTFKDEFVAALKHDVPGVLSMANRGPATNGSQFFITHLETPWLDGKHTVFGKVVTGQDVVNQIKQGDSMVKLTIGSAWDELKTEMASQIKTWNDALSRGGH